MVNYKCLTELTKNLKDKFENIQANTYGYSSLALYDTYHKNKNPRDFVKVMLFKGGYNPDYNEETKKFNTGEYVELYYNCTEYNKEEILKEIKKISDKYFYILDGYEENISSDKTSGFLHICENQIALERLHLPF